MAFLNGTLLIIYGKFTLSGRQSGRDPQIVIIFVSGCSYQYIDGYGTRHVWGFVHVTNRQIPDDKANVMAQQVSTLGVAFLRQSREAGISIGYTRNFEFLVADDTAGQLVLNLIHPSQSQYKNVCTLIAEAQ